LPPAFWIVAWNWLTPPSSDGAEATPTDLQKGPITLGWVEGTVMPLPWGSAAKVVPQQAHAAAAADDLVGIDDRQRGEIGRRRRSVSAVEKGSPGAGTLGWTTK
jgi:hypothetical protein